MGYGLFDDHELVYSCFFGVETHVAVYAISEP